MACLQANKLANMHVVKICMNMKVMKLNDNSLKTK